MIENKRPVYLSLQDYFKYGNHSVIALGYQKYKYSGVFKKGMKHIY